MAIFTQSGVHAPDAPSLTGAFFRDNGYTEAPIVVQCYLTLRCPLSCAHCLAAPDGRDAADMPVGTFDRLCAEAAALGVPEVLLTGGEPLAHSDLGAIVATLRRHSLSWSLNTACCPTPAQRTILSRHPPGYVAVSLDGPAAVHDAFRGRLGSHAAAMESLRWFASLGETTVCAGTTITTRNLDHLEDTFDIVRESGAHRWGIHLLLPEGRAGEDPSLFPTSRRMRGLLADIVRMRKRFPVSLCDEMGYAGEWEPLVRDEGFFCAAGRAMCAVLPDGSVMPCSTLDPRHCEGNLNAHSLATIWRTGFAAQRVPHREGKCARCTDWAVCGSGCWLQRVHGTQCFKHLWKIPDPLRAAAGIALCVGSLHGTRSAGADPAAAGPAGPNVSPAAGTVSTTATNAGDPNGTLRPLVLKGIFASKSGRPGLDELSATAAVATLRWINSAKNTDGTWGVPEQQVRLTSLATLAFLSRGITPSTSAEFGNTVNTALRFLLDRADAQTSRSPDDALLVWSLTDAYNRTRIPRLRSVVLKATDRLVGVEPTPFSVLAWQAVALSISDPPVLMAVRTALLDAMPASKCAADVAARCLAEDLIRSMRQREPVSAELRDRIAKWRAEPRPFMTALMAGRLLAATGRRDWNDWYNPHVRELLQSLHLNGSVAWWDLESLNLAKPAEVDGLSPSDTRIYITAMMILSLSPWQPEPTTLRPVDRAPVDGVVEVI